MKRKIFSKLIIFTLLNFCCAEVQITENNIKKELKSAALSLKKDRTSIYKLDDKTIGKKGYFYVLQNNGKITYHPKKALINSDFSRFPFIKKILKDRNGCLSFDADGTKRFVFFNEIDENEIICLTLEITEFIEPVNECDSNIEEKK